MGQLIKVCGLSTPETLATALDAGADLVGLVRFPRSPRHVDLPLARDLSRQAKGRALRVLLVVDPTDGELDQDVAVIDPDIVQLHGGETPERVAAIRTRTGRPALKALPIGGPADVGAVAAYRHPGERILLDARPPRDASAPGGNGRAFDWCLLGGLETLGLDPARDVVLSGGLTPDNVAAAIATTGVGAVDVSSGVERRPGVKDPELIASFVRAARLAFATGRAHERRTA